MSLKALTEDNLKQFDTKQAQFNFVEPKQPLAFPCNDSSRHVNDFNDWSFFKNRSKVAKEKKKKLVLLQSSFLWSDSMIERINDQQNYIVHRFVEEKIEAS